MNTKTKSIGWSYPSSPNADRFKFKAGCWTVSTTERNGITGIPSLPCAVAAFATRAEAEAHGRALPFPWDASYLAGGCGKSISVPGTNGGHMHCGGELTDLSGTKTREYCDKCGA